MYVCIRYILSLAPHALTSDAAACRGVILEARLSPILSATAYSPAFGATPDLRFPSLAECWILEWFKQALSLLQAGIFYKSQSISYFYEPETFSN